MLGCSDPEITMMARRRPRPALAIGRVRNRTKATTSPGSVAGYVRWKYESQVDFLRACRSDATTVAGH
jgi:hypothetical protein